MDEVLSCLEAVEDERRQRDADPGLKNRVEALKRFQQLRFAHTYRDLLASRRYGAAARFFLDDLYGPADFRQRDRQFARIVPRIDSVFPVAVSETIHDLARLHALSEQLDTAMARCMPNEGLDAASYVNAWLTVGRLGDRERQLDLVLGIGHAIERLTRYAWLVMGLKMMRGPARAAGLLELQQFLERGLASFRAMGGASDFLSTIEERERKLIQALFEGDALALQGLALKPFDR